MPPVRTRLSSTHCLAIWYSAEGRQNDDGMVDRGRSVARSGHEHPLRRLLGTRRGDGCCMAGKILSGEALVMNTLKERDALLEEQWKRFKKIPVNPDTEKLEKPFMDFPAGTDRLTIWKWFDERHSKGASYLMQNSQRRHTDEYMIRHWEKFRTECHFEDCVWYTKEGCTLPIYTHGCMPMLYHAGSKCFDYDPVLWRRHNKAASKNAVREDKDNG